MNCAKDGLAVVGKLAQETDEVPRGLAVETGRGLVKEEQRGATGEFNTDGETLASFDAQGEDERVRELCARFPIYQG